MYCIHFFLFKCHKSNKKKETFQDAFFSHYNKISGSMCPIYVYMYIYKYYLKLLSI